jgi:hypothetical protein
MTAPSTIRLVYRRSAIEVTDPSKLVELIFTDRDTGKLDESLSVYCISNNHQDAIQINAEHIADAGVDVSARATANLFGLHSSSCVLKSEEGFFKFRSETHAEIQFGTNMREAIEVARGLIEESDSRIDKISKGEIKGYAQQKFREGDNEWIQACSNPNVARWAKPETQAI